MPAAALKAAPLSDPAGDPAAARRRQWVIATAATEGEGALFSGAAPARPAPAPAPTRKTAPLRPTPLPVAMPVAAPAPVVHYSREERAAPSTARLAGLGLLAALGTVALYLVLSALFGFAQLKMDDLAYGRPRTTHVDAYFGHAGESDGAPSHVLALNLDRRIVLIVLPGGDTKGATTISGPYLFGANEDLTPVKLSVADVNGDNHADLLVSVKDEELVYINDKDQNSFHLITAEERTRLGLDRAQQGGGGPAPAGVHK